MSINILLRDSIIGYFNKVSPWDCFNKILDFILTLTKSEFGIVGLIRKDPESSELIIVPYGISNVSWTSTISNTLKFITFRVNKKNLLNYPIINKIPLLSNDPANHPDYSGTPEGHFKIESILSIPIIDHNEVIGIITLTNRKNGYDDDILNQVIEIGEIFKPIFQLYNSFKENMEYYGTKTMSDKILDFIDDGILVIDKFNKIIYCNKLFKKSFKIDDNFEIINKKMSTILPYIYNYYTNITDKIKELGNYTEQLLFEIDNENIPFYVTASEIIENSAPYTLIFFIPLSKYDSILRDELEKKDKYIYFINHEIRNSLQSILMSSFIIDNLIKKDFEKNKPKLEENIKIIDKSSKMIKKILDDIKNIEDISNGKIEIVKYEFNIITTIAKILEDFHNIIKLKNINFKYFVTDLICITDEVWLEKVLKAIFINSIRHCEDGGVISVSFSKKDNFEFTLTDNGKGYTDMELENLTSEIYDIKSIPDATIDPSFGTYQTNLILSKKIVEQLEGVLEITSKKNRGTKYFITIPYNKTIEQNSELNIQNILIVDDNSDNANTLKIFIEDINKDLKLGIDQVDSVYSGYECIGMVSEKQYQLIFLDINMIGMDGYKTAKTIKENGYKGDIIALTGNIYITSKSKNTLSNMKLFDDYLIKPANSVDVKKILMKYKKK